MRLTVLRYRLRNLLRGTPPPPEPLHERLATTACELVPVDRVLAAEVAEVIELCKQPMLLTTHHVFDELMITCDWYTDEPDDLDEELAADVRAYLALIRTLLPPPSRSCPGCDDRPRGREAVA
ncbi:hypothetical protein [Saccharopolyspora cebuensis]|uniref:hypothetical protein n=1 Tax=Saccharopolyspora cebuensis TaxID=418759 RepID=UPI0031EA78A5